MCQVVRSGGNVHGEAPLKTGVALSAVHTWEAGAGTAHYFARRRFTLTPLFLRTVQLGAAKCARRQKPGQWRPVVGPAGGLPGLGPEPASKMSRWSRGTRVTPHPSFITPVFYFPSSSSPTKSVFTGSLGCGNLSERKASGLVFCETNTSEYRKICVSSLWRPAGVSVSRVGVVKHVLAARFSF